MVKFTSKFLANDIINESFYKMPFHVLPRNKNDDFIAKYNLSNDEIGSILHSVRKEHFREKKKNEDKSIKANWLYYFSLLFQLVNEYGTKDLVQIYLKICEINNAILIVSIHD